AGQTEVSHPFVIGPDVEIGLRRQMVIEADALHNRAEYRQSIDLHFDSGEIKTSTNGTASLWRFPVLLKWSASASIVRPFFTGGATFQHTSGNTHVTGAAIHGLFPQIATTTVIDETYPVSRTWSEGVTIGAGAQFTHGWFHVSPQFRYTRWFAVASGGAPPPSANTPNRNLGEFLVAITAGK